jgi:cobalamin biosynthesis Mg chelatase CobN
MCLKAGWLTMLGIFRASTTCRHAGPRRTRGHAGLHRSHLLAANTEAFDAMADALLARGLNPLPLALESLKDGLCLQTLRSLCITHQVQIILNTTAFAALGEHARTGEAADALAGDIPCCR